MRLLERIAKLEQSAVNAEMSREQIEAAARKLLPELEAWASHAEPVELTAEEYEAAKRSLLEAFKLELSKRGS